MDKKSKEKSSKHQSRRHRIQLDGGSTELQISTSTSTRETRSSANRAREAESEIKRRAATTQPDTDTTQNPSASTSGSTNVPTNTDASEPHVSSPGATTSAASPRSSASQSPEPNCPICLGKLENKSFTNSCFHMFCFLCLLEWSKVKAECPLCKQSFKSIIHNVRSNVDYDEYYIQQHERIEIPLFDFAAPRFRYRTTVTDHRYTRQTAATERELQDLLLARPSRRQHTSNYRRLRQPSTSDFRRRIYLDRLKRVGSTDINTRRRVRETSPSFYRANSAQTHRLVPWLNRELNALLRNHVDRLAFVLDLIMELIMQHSIDSAEFYEHVYPYIGHHTRQFQQEFLLFARSPYHMAAYDRHTNYEVNTDPPSDHGLDSEYQPPSDSDVIVVSPSSSPQREERRDNARPLDLSIQPLVQNFFSRFTDIYRPQRPTATSGWDSPIRSPAWNIPTDSSSEDVDIVNTDPSSAATSDISPSLSTLSSFLSSSGLTSAPLFPFGSMQPLISPYYNPMFGNPGSHPAFPGSSLLIPPPTLPPPPVAVPSTSMDCPINVDQHDSDSNDSDVMIVHYEKPWLERSPIPLSSEESDFDVRITGEHRPGDPEVKIEGKNRKRKHEESEQTESSPLNQHDLTAVSAQHSAGRENDRSSSRSHYRSSKRRRHHTRTRSPDDPNEYRDPLLLQLFDIPQYKHKKYSKSRRDHSRHSKDRHSRDSKYSPESLSSHSSRSHTSSSHSGSESRVSIRSHKRRSTHSSIEIVEYHKHNTKHKKAKKHKKRKHSDEHRVEKQRDRHRRSSSSRHRKHSKSSKSSRHSHKHSKSNKQTISDHGCDERKENRDTVAGFSDDSDTEDYDAEMVDTNESSKQGKKSNETIYAEKEIGDRSKDVNKPTDFSDYYDKHINISADLAGTSTLLGHPTVDVRNLEVVELPLDQTGYFDKDLEMLAKSLAAPVEQEPSGIKTFKKHPHGHKKSRKNADVNATENIGSGATAAVKTTMADVVNTILHHESATTARTGDENIQSNLISSCTEGLDTTDNAATNDIPRENNDNHNTAARSLCIPTYYTSQYKGGRISNQDQTNSTEQIKLSEYLGTRKSHSDRRHLFTTESVSQDGTSHKNKTYDSPTCVGSTQNDSDFIDVDTISENSDIDITGTGDIPENFLAVPSYRTSKGVARNVATVADIIDVVGVSDEETNEERKRENKSQKHYVDVLGYSESVSSNEDIEVTKFDKATEDEIDITGVSDDDITHIQTVQNMVDVDLLGNIDNAEGEQSRAKHSSGDDLRITGTTAPKPVVLDSDSDDTDTYSNDNALINLVLAQTKEQSSCVLNQHQLLVIDDNISSTTTNGQMTHNSYANITCSEASSSPQPNCNINTINQGCTNNSDHAVPSISCLKNTKYSPTRQYPNCSASLTNGQYHTTNSFNQLYGYYQTEPSPQTDIDYSPVRSSSHNNGGPPYLTNPHIIPLPMSYSTKAKTFSKATGSYCSGVGSYSSLAMLNITERSNKPINWLVSPEISDDETVELNNPMSEPMKVSGKCSPIGSQSKSPNQYQYSSGSSDESSCESNQPHSSDLSPHKDTSAAPTSGSAQYPAQLTTDAGTSPVATSTPSHPTDQVVDTADTSLIEESDSDISVTDKIDCANDQHSSASDMDNHNTNATCMTKSLNSSDCASSRSSIGSPCTGPTPSSTPGMATLTSNSPDLEHTASNIDSMPSPASTDSPGKGSLACNDPYIKAVSSCSSDFMSSDPDITLSNSSFECTTSKSGDPEMSPSSSPIG